MDFGTKQLAFVAAVAPIPTRALSSLVHEDVSIREVVHTGKVGVNYRFWGYCYPLVKAALYKAAPRRKAYMR
jgi:hypothetical protein